nr:hypothetical protein [Candidatus Njordarchaeum guaymaensis]
MSKTVLPIQTTLHSDLKTGPNELLRIPASVVEEAADCLTEVVDLIEIGVIDENSSSAMRDRCFLCFNRVKRLVHLLQSTLKEGGD